MKQWLVILFFCLSSALGAAEKTVCLNMIVKNERDCIVRCLESVAPIIDYWVICDTGSTDGTQELIKTFMSEKKIPGELHERPWVNFSHNRNEALTLGKKKADYLLFIDADEYLVYDEGFCLPELDKDYYYFTLTMPGLSWQKISLVTTSYDWKWEGVLHEVIAPLSSHTFATVQKVKNVYTVDGARAKDPKKYEKDAEVLVQALKDDPTNSRYLFYLARCYGIMGNQELAQKTYKKRLEHAAENDLEAYYSALQLAHILEEQKSPSSEVIETYKKAAHFSPSRAEPYYYLACYYKRLGDYARAYQVASLGCSMPLPKDNFFIEEWIYDYGLLMELSVASYWAGKYKESQEASLTLLKKATLPEEYRISAETNLGFANAKLLEEVCKEE